ARFSLPALELRVSLSKRDPGYGAKQSRARLHHLSPLGGSNRAPSHHCATIFCMPENRIRCPWAKGDLYVEYHDKEWGVPSHDDRHLFELLILEGAQAGLSWQTILNKRVNYRRLFDEFHPEKVAL